MPQNNEYQLSANKKAYSSYYGNHQLSCDELFRIAQYYNRTKGITIYVQTYLPQECKPKESTEKLNATDQAFYDMEHIQKRLTPEQQVGYLFTNNRTGLTTPHVECFIITCDQIIKPITWVVEDFISVHPEQYDHTAWINLLPLTPQADYFTCGSLSLVYLKQLLKNHAEQFKNLCLSFPYFDSTGALQHGFIPSPQVLRYSQSTAYNKYLEAMVGAEDPGSFLHKEKPILYTTIESLLKQTIDTLQQQEHHSAAMDASLLLQQLPEFRQRWISTYHRSEAQRQLMFKQKENQGLAYTSKRMRKIATVEYERLHNPGLSLLEKIQQKKQEDNISDEALALFFKNDYSTLEFKTAASLGYFLNQLSKITNIALFFPKIFQETEYTHFIESIQSYMDVSFFLDESTRQNLHKYIRTSDHFKKITTYINDLELEYILPWIDAFQIQEDTKIDFLIDLLGEKEVSRELLLGLLNKKWDPFFSDQKTLSRFLTLFIKQETLISLLPELINYSYFNNINVLFESYEAFHVFVQEHLRFVQLIDLLKFNPHSSAVANYLNCFPESQRSTLLLNEVNDTSSPFFQLIANESYPKWVVNLLKEFCNEHEIKICFETHPHLSNKPRRNNSTQRLRFYNPGVPSAPASAYNSDEEDQPRSPQIGYRSSSPI